MGSTARRDAPEPQGPDTLAAPRSPMSWADHAVPLAAALAVLVLDRLTKWWALSSLRIVDPLTGTVRSRTVGLIPGALDFTYAENTGAAFSIFHNHPVILTAVSLTIAVAIFWWYWRAPREHTGMRVALGLVLGGAIGNLIDRIVRGSVVDFIHAFWRNHHWPTFNVADSAICVGIALLILWSYREQKKK